MYFLSALEPNALSAYAWVAALSVFVHHDLSSCHTHLAFYIVFPLPFRIYQDVSLLVRFQGPMERVELSRTKKNHKCKYYTF